MGGSEESTGDGVDIPDDGYRLDTKRVVVIVVTVAVVVAVFVVCGSTNAKAFDISAWTHTNVRSIAQQDETDDRTLASKGGPAQAYETLRSTIKKRGVDGLPPTTPLCSPQLRQS